MRKFIGALVGSCLLATVVWANQVSYQGILTNADGDSLLTGTYDLSFSIFPAATGGTARWTEAHADVSVQNGVYSVMLGATTPLPDSIGVNNWLQITVEATVLSPRLPITADFRAIESRHAQNADSVNHIAARTTPTPNHLVPLGADGKFPETVLPFTLDSILAGQGLTGAPALMERGGRNTLDERLTLNVGAGTGITVNADQVSATLGTSIATAEIEDNAVNSAKVQDNTLTAADALTNIVSMVDSVVNDGGNIDLIAGANITITPNDANNTITFTATGGGGGYSAGRCIELAGTTINNTMSLTAGDSCIRVVFDPTTCTYQLSSDLDVFAGDCIEIEYDDVTCDWTVSVDPACFDSIYDTEIYAESFVVIGDGTVEEPRAHLTNDGNLELRDGTGNEVYINPNGTMVVVHDGQPVSGVDPNGEMYAQSFTVIDPETGDTLSHLNNDGGLELIGDNGALYLNPNGTMVMVQDGQVVGGFDPNGEFAARSFMVIDPETGDTLSHLTNDGALEMVQGGNIVELDPIFGLTVSDSAGDNGIAIDPVGIIRVVRNGEERGGIDFDGEMYARSFYTIDSAGNMRAHLDNAGNVALPEGSQITIGGVPIAGGEGDTIRRINPNDSMYIGAFGLELYNSLSQGKYSADSMQIGQRDGEDAFSIFSDGRFKSTQAGEDVVGVDENGEVFANSFYILNANGDTITHLKNDGSLVMFDPTTSKYVIVDPSVVQIGNNVANSGARMFPDGSIEVAQDSVVTAGVQPNGEIHAKSFEVRDSLGGPIKAHLDNDGNLALPEGAQITIGGVPIGGGGVGDQIEFEDGPDNTIVNAGGVAVFNGEGQTLIGAGDLSVSGDNGGVELNANGTWSAGQNGVTVAGLDENGEVYARSFYVKDPASGDTLLHINSTGQITDATGAMLFDGTNIVRDGIHDVNIGSANGVSVTDGTVGAGINKDGLTVADFSAFNVFSVRTNGTWEASRDLVPIAALDSTGEIIAKSFEVRDSVTGETKAHLTNDGNLELPEGAQVLIGGVPIGGGGVGDQIEFEDGANSSLLDAEGLSVENGTVSNSLVNGTNVAVANNANTSYMDIQYDGTWEAKQNGVVVSGLQPNGEIHAKSFEVRDSLTGAIKAHLTNAGGLTATGTVSGQYVTGTSSVYSQNINGSTTLFSDLSAGSLRSQTLVSNVQTAGWTFFNNGTMTQWVDPPGATPPMLNMQTTNDGYWQFGMPVFFGNPANFNYLSGGTAQQGIMTSGNLTVNGTLKAEVIDPIIGEVFKTSPDYNYEPGVVIVADPNSDAYIPCFAAAQTSVVGVVTPKEKVDERGNISVTILGAASPPLEGRERLEVRVKADAKYGAIKRGDLLTTSATPGHAMLASDPKLGTIVGKALEPLENGTGEIKVMVTLQ